MNNNASQNDHHLLAITYVEAMSMDDKETMNIIVEQVGHEELLAAVSQLTMVLAGSAGLNMSMVGKTLDVSTVLGLMREVFLEESMKSM